LGNGWLASTVLAASVAAVVSLGLSSVWALRPLQGLWRDRQGPAQADPELALGSAA
jgi:hypothetical protein